MTVWWLSDRALDLPPPLAAGIVNASADSFFEGARSSTPQDAVDHGLALASAGFDLLDVGAVPAASGAPVSADEEAARLIPVVEGLARGSGVPLSVDTFQPEVARRALDAGAVAINDISGGNAEMWDLVAARGCGYVLMHIEGPPRSDRSPSGHADPVGHLLGWFSDRMEAAVRSGVNEEQIALDPGLDFDLSVADDPRILAGLGQLRALGRPLFVALSRKDFLGAVLAGSWESRAPAADREWATASATALAVAEGADVLRLHDRSALDALRVAAAIRGAGRNAPDAAPAARG
jgi:dihydropteroate synthase